MLAQLVILFSILVSRVEASPMLGALAPGALEVLVNSHCEPFESEVSNFAACPKVLTYRLNNLTEEKAKHFLETELYLSLFPSSLAEGTEELLEGLNLQAAALENHRVELNSKSTQKAFESFQNFVKNFNRKLKTEARSKIIYFDPSTYWAPSVEAKALVLIDLPNNTVEVVLHGLVDG